MSSDTAAAHAAPDQKIPPRYWVWLGGSTISALGVQILGFAMAWVAAGYGGAFAGLVLTAINLPRVVLLLLGGAIADRVGAWRVLIAGDAAMTAVTAAFAAALLVWGPSGWLLLIVAVLIGIVDAFYLPASGSMPRRLVPDLKLAQAMSARQVSSQLSGVLGGPTGAVVVASLGLAAAAAVGSATSAALFVLLLAIRPQQTSSDVDPQPGASSGGSVLTRALAGLRLSISDPLLRPALLMLVGTAAFLLPVIVPLVPVLARQLGWAPTHAGLIAGAAGIATAIVAIGVIALGGFSRPGLAGCGGLAISATGILGLAILPSFGWSIGSGALVGLGTGLFSTHIGPLVLGRTPTTHLARIQAVVALAQSLPLLVTNFVLGSLAQAAGARTSLLVCAGALLAIVAMAMTSPQLRAAQRSGRP